MIVSAALGALAGLGVVLARRGLFPTPAPLPTVFDRLARDGRSVAEQLAHPRSSRALRGVARRTVTIVGGRLGRRVEADLAVMDRTAERFAVEKLGSALAGAGACVALGAGVAAGPGGAPGGQLVLLVICTVAVAFVAPDVMLRRRAAARRSAFRHALSSYLDLVNVLLSGGAGVESALHGAADAGDGWAFEQIRSSLVRSHTFRESPWDSFAVLGRRLGIEQLVEIAASIELAGEHGARVRLSLAAKAAALRSHQMAAIEAEAHSATERMAVPMVLIFVGFIALLAYPALARIVTTL